MAYVHTNQFRLDLNSAIIIANIIKKKKKETALQNERERVSTIEAEYEYVIHSIVSMRLRLMIV